MMLKSTEVQIELLTSIDKILFVEQNVRGGMSYINQRYCATTRGSENLDSNTPDEIIYIDGNFPRKICLKNS